MRILRRDKDINGKALISLPWRNGRRVGLVIFKEKGQWYWFIGRWLNLEHVK